MSDLKKRFQDNRDRLSKLYGVAEEIIKTSPEMMMSGGTEQLQSFPLLGAKNIENAINNTIDVLDDRPPQKKFIDIKDIIKATRNKNFVSPQLDESKLTEVNGKLEIAPRTRTADPFTRGFIGGVLPMGIIDEKYLKPIEGRTTKTTLGSETADKIAEVAGGMIGMLAPFTVAGKIVNSSKLVMGIKNPFVQKIISGGLTFPLANAPETIGRSVTGQDTPLQTVTKTAEETMFGSFFSMLPKGTLNKNILGTLGAGTLGYTMSGLESGDFKPNENNLINTGALVLMHSFGLIKPESKLYDKKLDPKENPEIADLVKKTINVNPDQVNPETGFTNFKFDETPAPKLNLSDQALIKKTFGSKFSDLSKPEQENILKIKSESKDYQEFKSKLSSKPPDVPREAPTEPIKVDKPIKEDAGSEVKQERITDAAYKTPEGEIVKGTSHATIDAENKIPKNSEAGFYTSNGRFVNREEASTIAKKSKQISEQAPKSIDAYQFSPYGIKEPAPKSGAPKQETTSNLPKQTTEKPKKISAKDEFKVGDVIETSEGLKQTIREVKGNSIYFTDEKGQDYSGFSRSTLRNLVDGGSWKRVEKSQTTEKQPFELSVEELDNTLKKIEDRWSNPEYEVKDWERKFVDEFNRLKKKTSSEVLSDLDATTEMRKRFPNADVYRGFFRNAISEGKIESHPDYPELKPVSKDVKKTARISESLDEALLDYLVQGGSIKPTKTLPKSSLEAMGIPKNRISETKGANPETIFSSIAPHLENKYLGEAQSQIFEDILLRYNSHESRVEGLKKLRGELTTKEKQAIKRAVEDNQRLDEVILNEYLDTDGNLRTNDILKDVEDISRKANVDKDTIFEYLQDKQREVYEPEKFDDVFGEIFNIEDIKNERAKEIVNDSSPAELEKLAADIESKARSEKEADLNEAINKADELILTPPETKTKQKNQQLGLDINAEVKFKGSEDYLEKKGQGEDTTPLFNQPTEVKGQENLFTEPKPETTIERLRREAKEESLRNLNKTNLNFSPSDFQAHIKLGAYHIKNGIKTFAEFSKQMIKDLGEKILPYLSKLWQGAKDEFAKGIFKVYESKFNPSRPLGLDDFKSRFRGIDKKIDEKIDKTKLEIPDETIKNVIERKIADKYNRAGITVKEAEKIGTVTDAENFRLQIENHPGRAGAQIEDLDKYLTNPKDGFLKRLTDAKFSPNDLGEYMYAKHAPYRNLTIFKKFGKKFGSGIKATEAKEILKKYEGTEIDKFAEEFRAKIIKPALYKSYKSGLITKEHYEELRNRNDFYVPLKGFGDTPKSHGTGRGFSTTSSGIIRMKGRGSIPENPFLQMIEDAKLVVVRSEKNKVGQSFLEFATKYPSKAWDIKSQKYVPERNKFGEIIGLRRAGDLKENQLGVYVDGKLKIITIYDPVLASSLKNLGVERGIKGLNTINTVMRSLITYYNPEFILTNFERDMQTALINIGGEHSLTMAKNVAKDVPAIMKDIWRSQHGKGSQWYDRYRKAGGKASWLDYKDVETIAKDFENKIKFYNSPNSIKKGLIATEKFISDLNEAVENAFRTSTFKNLVESGMSEEQAAAYSKNLTVNFNKKGEWGQAINSAYLFWNAGMQGSVRLYKALKHPRVRKIAAGLIGLSTLSGLLNRQINKEEYDKIEDWEKDTNWIFMIPGSNKHLKIRLPYGYNVFNVMGNITADMISGQKDIGKLGGRLLKNTVDAFNPFGTAGSVAQYFSPTAFRPIVQISENKTFTGAPIHKEQPAYQPKVPESQLYFKSVRPTTKAFTDWLNKTTGGNKTVSGDVDINPENIDFLLDYYGGGVAKFVQNSIVTGQSLLSEGSFPDLRNIPIARQVLGESGRDYNKNEIYSQWEESGRTRFNEEEKLKFIKDLGNAYFSKQINAEEYKRLKTSFLRNQNKISKETK